VKSRLLAGVAAVVLALIGAILVFSYAQGADQRAMEGMEPVEVLVVQEAVPEGTPVEALAEFVAPDELPRTAVPASALATLDEETGKVTATDLQPGEQLLKERLVDPAELQTPGSVPVPKGLQEVTFALDPPRIVGGKVAAGDTVGVFVSFDNGALEDQAELATTQRVFHKMLVTSVQRADAAAPPAEEGAEPNPEALPTGTLLVTVAAKDADVAKIVFSAEFGRIWLSKEPEEATEGRPKVMLKSDVYP
jgi:pilus assembly protein CpaB